MMTENDAKMKACPFAATFGASQQLADGPGPNCVGSACMAWRGGESVEFRMAADAEFKRTGKTLRASGEEITGYCGLAGKP